MLDFIDRRRQTSVEIRKILVQSPLQSPQPPPLPLSFFEWRVPHTPGTLPGRQTLPSFVESLLRQDSFDQNVSAISTFTFVPDGDGKVRFMYNSTFETQLGHEGPAILLSCSSFTPRANHQLLEVGEPSIIALVSFPNRFVPSPLKFWFAPFESNVMVTAVSMLVALVVSKGFLL